MSSGFRSSCYWTDWNWANTENIRIGLVFAVLALWKFLYCIDRFDHIKANKSKLINKKNFHLANTTKNQSYTDIFRIGPIPVHPITARSESARRFDNRKEMSREMSVVCWSWKWRDADQTGSWKTLKMCRMHLLKIILDTTICQEWKQMI